MLLLRKSLNTKRVNLFILFVIKKVVPFEEQPFLGLTKSIGLLPTCANNMTNRQNVLAEYRHLNHVIYLQCAHSRGQYGRYGQPS